MSEQRPSIVDALYLDAEHFALTASQQRMEPRERVVPTGRPFPGLPREASAGLVRPEEERASGKATLGGHPDGPLVTALPTAWTVPPPVAYVHKLCESGRYLSDARGVFGVRFRLMTRADGSPVVLPDGTLEYWYAPDEEPTT
jgi:hypothetical protein